MPRKHNSLNTKVYHYLVKYKDENDGFKDKEEYFFTRKEIVNKFGMSINLIDNFLKDPNYQSTKYKYVKVERVNVPAIEYVMKPVSRMVEN
jgi:hypothetical protein